MAEDPQGTRINARLVVGAIAVILVVAFAWANSKRVPINFLVGTHNARLIYVILGSALLGAIAGRCWAGCGAGTATTDETGTNRAGRYRVRRA